MSVSFDNKTWRCAAIAISVALAIWFIWNGLNHALASHYGASANPDDWSRAARIEPGNAENWYRLGRYRELDFDHVDIPLAITYYRRAVQLDPRSPYYKLDLASTLEMSGNDAEADNYYRGAQANYPVSAEVSWRYGNFLLRQQRLPEAYAEIQRAVAADPKLTSAAISRAWHSDPGVQVLLDKVLPNTPQADWQALSFLTDSHDRNAAMVAWNRLIPQKPAMDWPRVFAFIDFLTSQNHFDEARSVWLQATGSDGASANSSLIYDGGFEKPLTNGGFGWSMHSVPGAEFDFDTGEAHSGARSARVTFDGTQNIDYQYLSQRTVVASNTRYRFRGFLKTDQISTDSGVRFEIRGQGLDVLTPNETETQAWTMEETDFTTGPQTHLIQIFLRRMPSAHLDNKISGTVWVDDVAVLPVGPSQ